MQLPKFLSDEGVTKRVNVHKGRFRYGSSVLAFAAMALAAFCPVCVFSMFFGAISLGIGLAISSYLPVFLKAANCQRGNLNAKILG